MQILKKELKEALPTTTALSSLADGPLKGLLEALRKFSQNHQQLIRRGKQDYQEFQGKEQIYCGIFEKACGVAQDLMCDV